MAAVFALGSFLEEDDKIQEKNVLSKKILPNSQIVSYQIP